VENVSVPSEKSDHQVRKRRRKGHNKGAFKSGRLAVWKQIAIVVAALAIAFLVLQGVLMMLSQPPPHVQVDQNILDAQ